MMKSQNYFLQCTFFGGNFKKGNPDTLILIILFKDFMQTCYIN